MDTRLPLVSNEDIEEMLYALQRIKAHKALKESGIKLTIPASKKSDNAYLFLLSLKSIFRKADRIGTAFNSCFYYIRDARLINEDVEKVIKKIYNTEIAEIMVGELPEYFHDGDVLIIEASVDFLVGEWITELIRHFWKKGDGHGNPDHLE